MPAPSPLTHRALNGNGQSPLLVTRQNGPNAVVLDEEEFEGMLETMHLLQSPKNAMRLRRAIAQLKSRLQRTNPVEEAAAHRRMFSELIVLEARSKELRTRSIGAAD